MDIGPSILFVVLLSRNTIAGISGKAHILGKRHIQSNVAFAIVSSVVNIRVIIWTLKE